MRRRISALLLAFSVFLVGAHAQEPKRTLKPEDYSQWEALNGSRISNDGHWVAFGLGPIDGDPRLVVRNVDTPQSATIPNGQVAQFSDDSKWVAYTIGVPKKEADQLREQKKPIENKLGLRNLANGQEQILDGIQDYDFTKGSKFLIAHRYRGATKPDGGSDLIILNLLDGSNTTLGNVASWKLNHAETQLAALVQSDSGTQGVQLMDLSNYRLTNLHWSRYDLANLEWSKVGNALSFMVGIKDEKKDGDWNTIVYFPDATADKPVFKVFDLAARQDAPKGLRVVEYGGLNMSDDGKALAFGIRQWDDKKKPSGKPEDKADVDIWNYKDLRIQPQQKRQAPQDLHQSLLCIWRPESDSFMQVNDDPEKLVMLMRDYKHAVIVDESKYRSSVTSGASYQDIWVVDLISGHKTRAFEKTYWVPSPSLTGKYFAQFDGRDWWIYDCDKDKKTNVTASQKGVSFVSATYDGTLPERPAEAGAIWLKGDAGAIFCDQYDNFLWRSGTDRVDRLTEGYKDKVLMRPISVHPQPDEPGIPMDEPMYFSAFDKVNKGSGLYRRELNGQGKMITFDSAHSITGVTKADDADRMTFIMGNFEQSPNLFVTNGLFTQAKPMSKTNPQQAKFLWGKAELVQFKNRGGVPLQGRLIYPADYKPGRKYPMIVYIYERLSDQLNTYTLPVDWSPYNAQIFSQNGYFVLMPDIVYKARQPGKSALDCIEPAIDEVLKKGMVDPAKVGLVGHSWGGYQTAFVATQSKKLAVAVAGAPLIDLISMFGTVYWNSGTPDQELMETGQGRLQVPYWQDMKTYMDESPLFNASKLNIPLMLEEGDQDGAVDWHQSLEMYTTLRRMGKNVVFLVYPGENHNVARRPNQLDYAHRVRHFFDVYLKGAKPEAWVTDGVPFIKKG